MSSESESGLARRWEDSLAGSEGKLVMRELAKLKGPVAAMLQPEHCTEPRRAGVVCTRALRSLQPH